MLCKISGVGDRGGGVNKVHLFIMLSMKMVNGKTGKYVSDIQLNLSTMATLGTEERSHCKEVATVEKF